MPDDLTPAQQLGNTIGPRGEYLGYGVFANDVRPGPATVLADLQAPDINPTILEPKLRFSTPAQEASGLARSESDVATIIRTAAVSLRPRLYGYFVTLRPPGFQSAFLLAARRFPEPVVLASVGSSFGLSVTLAAAKLSEPGKQTLAIDVQHRLHLSRPGVHGKLRVKLRRLQEVLRRLLAREGRDLERADLRGTPYLPFIPDELADEAAQEVLARCAALLGN